MYTIVDSTVGREWRRLLPLLKQLVGCESASDEAVLEWQRSLAASGHDGAVQKETERLFGPRAAPMLLPVAAAMNFPLGEVLGRLRDATLLLFYTRPELALTIAMAEGKSPADELAAWRESAARILDAYHHNHQHAILVNVESALAHPADFCLACCKHLQVESTGAMPCALAESKSLNSVHCLIAAHMVAQEEDIRGLVNELEANSLPLGPGRSWDIDCEDVFGILNEEFGNLKEENELLLLQLRQLQEELESYYLEACEVTSQRKSLILEKQRLGRELDWKTQELAQARNTMSMVFASWSWRMTRPMRVIARFLRGQPIRSKAT